MWRAPQMGFWEKAVEPGDSHLNGSGNTNGKRSEGDKKTGDNKLISGITG